MSVLPPSGTTIAIYARYSTKHQDARSIEGQVALCKDYAERHGWQVAAVYSDAERSGTTLIGRVGFFEMMAAAERQEFQVLLVEDIDRASRDAADTHGFVKSLKELDIALCTVSGGVISDLEIAFKAVQNAEYVKQNTEKTKRGQRHAVQSGRISGSTTYGHRKVHTIDGRGKPINGLRELHPEHVVIVERIFLEYAAGVSTIDICRRLNAEGIPSPRGKLWGPGVLTGSAGATLGILRNRLYIGEFYWGRTKRKRKKGKIETRPTMASDRLFSEFPELAFIDRDLFDRVQARLERGGAGPFRSQRQPDYLFSRKLACGCCGQPYVIMNKRLGCVGRAKMGVCENSRRVPREDVEKAILDRLKEHILKPAVLEPCLKEYRIEAERAFAEHSTKVEQGQGRLKEIEQRISNLVGQIGDAVGSTFAKDIMMQEIDRLGSEKQRLDREAKQKPRPVGPALDTATVAGRLADTLSNLHQALQSDDREASQAREVLRSLVDRIVISPASGTQVDGRGAGSVSITVQGRLAELLGLVDIPLDRAIQHEPRTETLLDDTVARFEFSFVLTYLDPRTLQTIADVAILAGLLDRAEAPITKQQFLTALRERGKVVNLRETKSIEDRLRYALESLSEDGSARPIRMGPKLTGWVWNHWPLYDEDWKARARWQERHRQKVLRLSAELSEARPS